MHLYSGTEMIYFKEIKTYILQKSEKKYQTLLFSHFPPEREVHRVSESAGAHLSQLAGRQYGAVVRSRGQQGHHH